MKPLKYTYGETQVEGYAQKIAGKLWVYVNGKTFTYEPPISSRRGQGKGQGKSLATTIHAPMPGKVTKLLVDKNSKLKSGQAVVVMEAMKMEYSLKCDLDGSVEEVLCKVGEQVALGQTLVKLKAAETKSE